MAKKPAKQTPNRHQSRRMSRDYSGVSEIVEILRRGNLRGVYLDTVLTDLEDYAAECIDDVIIAFRHEKNRWLRRLLLSVIAETGAPAATPVLRENLGNQDETLRSRALVGLMNVGTREARQALQDARTYTFDTPEETEAFQYDIDNLLEEV